MNLPDSVCVNISPGYLGANMGKAASGLIARKNESHSIEEQVVEKLKDKKMRMPTTGLGPAQSSNQAGARIVVLVVVAFVLGLACGGYFYFRKVKNEMPAAEQPVGIVLSDSTRAILQRLDAPVDIRFYSPADPTALPDSLSAFASRVLQLLSAYEQAGGGNVRLVQSDPALQSLAKTTAGAEGVLPFSGNNGQVCYLGITVVKADRKETIPQLSPDWEAALESDISRAIARVSASMATPVAPTMQSGSSTAPVNPAISEELLRTIPDLESRSFDDAAKLLREGALAEFKAAVQEMQSKVQETQNELAAQSNAPDVDQQAAVKHLQQVQAEQSKKLSEITARLQARLQVLERLKGVNRSNAK